MKIYFERVVYHEAIQMYKTVCGNAPDYLKNELKKLQSYKIMIKKGWATSS